MTVQRPRSTASRSRYAVIAAAVLSALACPDAALAQALDIDQPEITKGEHEVKSVNVINGRYRPGSAGLPRSSHELSATYSPTDWFKVTAHLDAENVLADGWRLDHAAIETQFKLIEDGKSGGLGLGWFTNLQVSTDTLSTNSLIFGPIVKLSGGRVSVTFNPYLEHTFGRNSGRGPNLVYGWEGRLGLQKGFAVGLQSFGKIENIGDAPPWREQDHRVGPALFLEWEAGADRSIALDMAVLAGLTDAAPNVSLKFNLGTTF